MEILCANLGFDSDVD